MARLLVSLGGNALGTDFDELVASVGVVARPIVDLIEEGHQVVICHGNGPQVGMIKSSIDRGKAEYHHPSMPLSETVAMSQAYIGYHLQNAIENQLHAHGIDIEKSVATVISRTLVDVDDPGFERPTKPIGAFFSAEEAERLRATGKVMVEDAGRGYREVVPSPRPLDILEKDVIVDMIESGHVVIAGGGGGIPIVFADNWYRAIDAVIDKDWVSVLIAELADCDALVILTGVEQVALDFTTPQRRGLSRMTVQEAERYIAEGQFPEGSMLPKVQAAVDFARSGENRRTLITSLDKLLEGLREETGTWVVP